MLSWVILIFETWLYRRKMFRIKKTTEIFLSTLKNGWIIQESLLYHAILQTIGFLELILEPKLLRIKKQFPKNMTFIIGCLSQSEKATSSCCYLANYWLLRIKKNDLRHRMYEKFRKSHIIMLSPKLLTFDSWLCSKSCLKSKNN